MRGCTAVAVGAIDPVLRRESLSLSQGRQSHLHAGLHEAVTHLMLCECTFIEEKRC